MGIASTVHKPLGKGPLWKTDGLQLPAGLQHLAHALMERGMGKSKAIAVAKSRLEVWARGGGDVRPETQAAARKVLAEWDAAQAKAHATPNKDGRTTRTAHPARGAVELADGDDDVAVPAPGARLDDLSAAQLRKLLDAATAKAKGLNGAEAQRAWRLVMKIRGKLRAKDGGNDGGDDSPPWVKTSHPRATGGVELAAVDLAGRIVELAAERVVRTRQGALLYGVPIGSKIPRLTPQQRIERRRKKQRERAERRGRSGDTDARARARFFRDSVNVGGVMVPRSIASTARKIDGSWYAASKLGKDGKPKKGAVPFAGVGAQPDVALPGAPRSGKASAGAKVKAPKMVTVRATGRNTELWAALRAAGFKGRPDDGLEALYVPPKDLAKIRRKVAAARKNRRKKAAAVMATGR